MHFKTGNIGLSLLLGTAIIMAGCGSNETTESVNVNSTEKTSSNEENVAEENGIEENIIKLNDHSASLNGKAISEFDYTWNISPDQESEWYEGTEPETTDAAYIAHDICYYPALDENSFTQDKYDGETEWVSHYTAEGLTEYIFSTLPVFGDSLPTEMMHTADEAYDNPVLHITQPGTYVLEGQWHGQIMVDLGDKDEAFTDEQAKVTLVLNGADITCDCGPGVFFYSAYECDNDWENADTHSGIVDTTNAGANVEIADGTVNNVTGANVYRLLKATYKNEETKVQKKAHKTDGAFYSCISMNIEGGDTGILNITSTTYEGLDSELHLTMNGGFVNIYSQDDAINVNEDDVSVFTMNGGTLHIFAGLGVEGDGIDSNGFITVNGGTIAGGTPSGSDSLLDADCEIAENGGSVIVIGSGRMGGGMPGGMPGGLPEGMERPNGMERPDGKEHPDGMTPPEGMEHPEGMTPPEGMERPDGTTPPDGSTPPDAR